MNAFENPTLEKTPKEDVAGMDVKHIIVAAGTVHEVVMTMNRVFALPKGAIIHFGDEVGRTTVDIGYTAEKLDITKSVCWCGDAPVTRTPLMGYSTKSLLYSQVKLGAALALVNSLKDDDDRDREFGDTNYQFTTLTQHTLLVHTSSFEQCCYAKQLVMVARMHQCSVCLWMVMGASRSSIESFVHWFYHQCGRNFAKHRDEIQNEEERSIWESQMDEEMVVEVNEEELVENIQMENTQLKDDNEKLRGENEELKNIVEEEKNKGKKLKKEVEKLKKAVEEEKKKGLVGENGEELVENVQMENTQLKDDNEKLRGENEELKNIVEEEKNKGKKLKKEVEKLKKAVEEEKKKGLVGENGEELVENVQMENTQLKDDNEKLRGENERLKKRFEENMKDMEKKVREMNTVVDGEIKMREDVVASEKELRDNIQMENTQLKETVKQLEKEVEDEKKKVKELEERNEQTSSRVRKRALSGTAWTYPDGEGMDMEKFVEKDVKFGNDCIRSTVIHLDRDQLEQFDGKDGTIPNTLLFPTKKQFEMDTMSVSKQVPSMTKPYPESKCKHVFKKRMVRAFIVDMKKNELVRLIYVEDVGKEDDNCLVFAQLDAKIEPAEFWLCTVPIAFVTCQLCVEKEKAKEGPSAKK